jgi:hypothetical protein
MEAQHKHKIGTEMSRYQALLQEKGDLNRQWDEDNQALVDRYTITLLLVHYTTIHCIALQHSPVQHSVVVLQYRRQWFEYCWPQTLRVGSAFDECPDKCLCRLRGTSFNMHLQG